MTAPRVPRARQAGFGLVELMVSLVLGLLVVGGAVMMFGATRQANSTSENLSRIQESVRTSWDQMVREVREAGATPCDTRARAANVLTNAQGASPTWWAVWDDAGAASVAGFAGLTAFPGAAFGTAVGQRVSGTDAVIVRYGASLDGLQVQSHNSGSAVITANRSAHGIGAGDLLMMCTYSRAAIFQATAANTATGTITHATSGATPGNCATGLGLFAAGSCNAPNEIYQYPAGAAIGRFVAAGWFIGNNGRAGTGGRSLYRVTAAGTEEVTDGVRDMQLRYLQDGNATYVGAGGVTDWSAIVALQFDLVVEGPDAVSSTAASAPRLTRNVAFTVYLRNNLPST